MDLDANVEVRNTKGPQLYGRSIRIRCISLLKGDAVLDTANLEGIVVIRDDASLST